MPDSKSYTNYLEKFRGNPTTMKTSNYQTDHAYYQAQHVAGSAKDADGKFPCLTCNKTYLHAKHLKRHMLRHADTRPNIMSRIRNYKRPLPNAKSASGDSIPWAASQPDFVNVELNHKDGNDLKLELENKWILNLSMHFRDRSDREKFFVTYRQGPGLWRRVTVSCDYRKAESDSLESQLKQLQFQRDKSARIYEAIRDLLPDIQFYDIVTNLKLETTEGRLHIHVTEDVLEKPGHFPSSHPSSPQQKPSERDATRAGIPPGYSFKNWDPTEVPILLLGNVFGANSLGKWIYDWPVSKGDGVGRSINDDKMLLITDQPCGDQVRQQQVAATSDRLSTSGQIGRATSAEGNIHGHTEDPPDLLDANPQPRKVPSLWNGLQNTVRASWLNLLLLFLPIGLLSPALGLGPKLTFIINFIAIIPLAALLSYATEEIAMTVGAALGGIINATFGNLVETVISVAKELALWQIVTTFLLPTVPLTVLLAHWGYDTLAVLQIYYNDLAQQCCWPALMKGTAVTLLLLYGVYLFHQYNKHAELYAVSEIEKEKTESSRLYNGKSSGGSELLRASNGTFRGARSIAFKSRNTLSSPLLFLLMATSAAALPIGNGTQSPSLATAPVQNNSYEAAMSMILTVMQDWIVPSLLLLLFIAVLCNPRDFRGDGEYLSALLAFIFGVVSTETYSNTDVRGPTRWAVLLFSIACSMLYTHVMFGLYEIRKSWKGRVTMAVLLTLVTAGVLAFLILLKTVAPESPSETGSPLPGDPYEPQKAAFTTWLPICYIASTFLVLGYGGRFFDTDNKLKK